MLLYIGKVNSPARRLLFVYLMSTAELNMGRYVVYVLELTVHPETTRLLARPPSETSAQIQVLSTGRERRRVFGSWMKMKV